MNPKSVDRFETELAGAAAAVVAKMGRKGLPPLPSGPAMHFLTRRRRRPTALCNGPRPTSVVEPGGAEGRHLPLRRDHRPGDRPAHLLLRSQLAPGRAGGRLLRHSAQQRDGTPHDLLHLGHVASASPQGDCRRPPHVSQRFGGEGEGGAHPHALAVERGRHLPVLRAESAWERRHHRHALLHLRSSPAKVAAQRDDHQSRTAAKGAWRPSAAG